MRFQPSVYSDVAASAPPAGAAEGELTASVAKLGTQVVGMGLDSWQARADSRANKWRTLAAKKAKKAKKAAAARDAQRQQAMLPPVALPAPVATGMEPWMKWGLIVAGIGVVGFAAFVLLRKKPEPKPKPNPKRTFIKQPPKTRVVRVRAAATEIPETVEVEEVGEVEERHNDEDDGYGDGYDGGAEEGDE